MFKQISRFLRSLLSGLTAGLIFAALTTSVAAQPAPSPEESRVPAPTASQFSGQLVLDWMQLSLLLAQQTPGMSPPVTARA
ncbi:MAG: hypothetical protein EAZ37_16900, partial [Burkholderiales bacterium]